MDKGLKIHYAMILIKLEEGNNQEKCFYKEILKWMLTMSSQNEKDISNRKLAWPHWFWYQVTVLWERAIQCAKVERDMVIDKWMSHYDGKLIYDGIT